MAWGDADEECEARPQCETKKMKDVEEVVEAAPADMRAIIMKQKANGSWALSEVASLLGSLSAEKIKKALSSLVQGDITTDIENVWATAVVVAFLQVFLSLSPPPLLSGITLSSWCR